MAYAEIMQALNAKKQAEAQGIPPEQANAIAQATYDQVKKERGGILGDLKRAAPAIGAATTLIPGIGPAIGGVLGGAASKIPGVTSIMGAADKLKGVVGKVQDALPGDLSWTDIITGAGGALGVHDQIKGRKVSGEALKRLRSVKPVDLSDVFQSDSPYARPLQRMAGAKKQWHTP